MLGTYYVPFSNDVEDKDLKKIQEPDMKLR